MGDRYLPTFGCSYGKEELEAAKAVLDSGRLTYGPICVETERKFSSRFLYHGAPGGVFVNSGSSSVMLALDAVKECLVGKNSERPRLITTALGFPTPLASALRLGYEVTVIDSEVDTLNFDPVQFEEALDQHPTSVLLLVHMMGNPYDIGAALQAAKHTFTVADCCDALGSTWASRQLAEYASVACFALYPAHHLTSGEGGMVVSRDHSILEIARSLRDWGRDCRCLPNQDNRCGKRFDWRLSGIGWDHKFIYTRQGYNLKPLEIQGAILDVQMSHFPELHDRRMKNIGLYESEFDSGVLSEFFIHPRVLTHAEASWMAYPLIIRSEADFEAPEFARRLEAEGVGTRRLLGGDLTEQPAFRGDERIKKSFSLKGTRDIMRRVVLVGCHPGLDESDIGRIIETAARVAGEDLE